MTPNAQQITSIAVSAWADNMPVSFAVQECCNRDRFRPWITRFITTIYDGLDADPDQWLRFVMFGDQS